MEHIEDRLAAMTLTPYEGLNPELGDSTPCNCAVRAFQNITNRQPVCLGYEVGKLVLSLAGCDNAAEV